MRQRRRPGRAAANVAYEPPTAMSHPGRAAANVAYGPPTAMSQPGRVAANVAYGPPTAMSQPSRATDGDPGATPPAWIVVQEAPQPTATAVA